MAKKILVTGWYHTGNFGDDLMGIVLGLYLKKIGHDGYVAGIKDLHAKYHDIALGDLPAGWENEYEAVIYGGGGIYTNLKLLNGKRDEYDYVLEEIMDKAKEKGLPVYVISAGADRQFDAVLLPPGRKKMFDYATLQTVRNKSDHEIMQASGKEGIHYFPDMLWRTSDFFPFPAVKHSGDIKKIAVNIEMKGSPNKLRVMNTVFYLLAKLNPGIEFVFMDVWYGGEAKIGSMTAPKLKNCSNYPFVNINDDIAYIRSFDLVITSKLHIGLVAMSYGVPVVSYQGEEKTQIFFESLGLKELCVTIKNSFKLFSLVKNKKKISEVNALLHSEKVKEVKDRSLHHYLTLKNLLEK